jgi:hypothetical protein
MPPKPKTRAGYSTNVLALVRAACLEVATKLGDLTDELVIVGGLVPSLIIEQDPLPADRRHAGTTDLDIGLALTLLNSRRYDTVVYRLRDAGFAPDRNEAGNPTSQRWRMDGPGRVTVDFLIPPSGADDPPGQLKHLSPGFAAIIAPGLHLAFRDHRMVAVAGTTFAGANATRSLWVCGPGAFIVLKALAFRNRGANKDAYDLHYVLTSFGEGTRDVANALAPLLGDPAAEMALAVLHEDFCASDALGPVAVATFLTGGPTAPAIRADVAGFTVELLHLLGR